jgi:hypothetical protein
LESEEISLLLFTETTQNETTKSIEKEFIFPFAALDDAVNDLCSSH